MANFSEKELQQYTKDELIYFLKKVQIHIPKYEIESMKSTISWKRYEEIGVRIQKILTDSADLANKYNETYNLEILVKLQKLNKERDKLWAKEKKLQKELLGS